MNKILTLKVIILLTVACYYYYHIYYYDIMFNRLVTQNINCVTCG